MESKKCTELNSIKEAVKNETDEESGTVGRNEGS